MTLEVVVTLVPVDVSSGLVLVTGRVSTIWATKVVEPFSYLFEFL